MSSPDRATSPMSIAALSFSGNITPRVNRLVQFLMADGIPDGLVLNIEAIRENMINGSPPASPNSSDEMNSGSETSESMSCLERYIEELGFENQQTPLGQCLNQFAALSAALSPQVSSSTSPSLIQDDRVDGPATDGTDLDEITIGLFAATGTEANDGTATDDTELTADGGSTARGTEPDGDDDDDDDGIEPGGTVTVQPPAVTETSVEQPRRRSRCIQKRDESN